MIDVLQQELQLKEKESRLHAIKVRQIMKNYNSQGSGIESLHNSDAEGIMGQHDLNRSRSNTRNGTKLKDDLSYRRGSNASRGTRMTNRTLDNDSRSGIRMDTSDIKLK